ncbi:helix-turn-helix transcriptional regulator [Phaeodactylibacter luteus]|uniref:HTH luxR-type domain-containing protein n=1 Tax=Phaeodactylibacter luteus TaxID=1564516 RepID=A0A5C6S6L2_9BACT|nr:helix-turn-helix transcriptional regulator [Phaeodactylibacter luteus]TXB69452.1 hypothetical protein FRY97_01175 [Phaeodactylibacter luteus]
MSTPETPTVYFTPHQLHILEVWSNNRTLEDTATACGLSVHTINTHLKRMRKRAGVNRTFDLWKYACDTKQLKP